MIFSDFPITDSILVIIFVLLAIPLIKATSQAPFVPTPKGTTRKMLDFVKIQPGQSVYDLGCGDGRFVRMASRKYGAKAIGVELNPLIYLYAKILSFGRKNETILFQDFMQTDLRKADVVVCYLLPKTMAKLEKKLKNELKQGAKVVSHGFLFQDWRPKGTFLPQGKEYGKIYLFEKEEKINPKQYNVPE